MARPPYFAKLQDTEIPFVVDALKMSKQAVWDTLKTLHHNNPEGDFNSLRRWIDDADALSDRLEGGIRREAAETREQ